MLGFSETLHYLYTVAFIDLNKIHGIVGCS